MKTLIATLLLTFPAVSIATTLVCKTTDGEILLVFYKNNQVGIQWVMKGSAHGKVVKKTNTHTVIITHDNKGTMTHRFALNNITLGITEFSYIHPVNGSPKIRKDTGTCIQEWP